ncbi:SPOR domain-containing protein [Yoonia sp. R2331]|uniref:SPOR domain-containing protein n=1 Tax=Yoonia sp. R2331 TaxID=3237238 RepID=UPI0034E61952
MSSIGHMRVAVLALMVSTGGAAAQGDLPAEFPPADFAGNQFVDSNGCAFIRAGIGGATNWVPRVSRSRQPLCNFQPTFPAGVAGPATGSGRVAPLDAPIIEITPPAASVAAAPAPSPAPVRTRAATAPIQTIASIPATPVVAPSPQIITPPPAAEPPRVTLAEACQGRFGIQPGFVSARTGDPIDCGPAPAAVPVSAPAPVVPAAPEPLRMTLAEVCAEVAATGTRFVRPDGSPIVCDTPAPAPVVIATATVPTTAPAPIAASTGLCPGKPHLNGDPALPMRCGPQVEKPYTEVSPGGGTATVSTSGFFGLGAPTVPASNPIASRQAAPQVPAGYEQVWTDGRINPQRGQVAQSAPRISTRSAAPAQVRAPAAAATMTHRYVQVGTFGDPANATRMIQRLGGMGFPVASAKSGSLKVIAAGPFNTPAELARALNAVRGMGFADAYTRN